MTISNWIYILGGEIPSWRLVNIKETEDETIV